MTRRIPVAAGAALLLPTAAVSAQSGQPYSVQGSAFATTMSVGEKVVGGMGVEFQLRDNDLVATRRGVLSAGLGVQATSHSRGADRINLRGLFLEPRYTFALRSERWFPYAAARLALLQQDANFATSSSGFGAGLGGGLVYGIARRVNLDLGGALLRQSFGDAEYTRAGPFLGGAVTFPAFTGYALKVGVNIGLGSG